MGMGFLPYQPCAEYGIPFALGTDFTGVTTDDLFTQMNMALQIERALANDKVHQRDTMPFEITPTVREALHWATLGAAQVLGMENEIGSLVAGKSGHHYYPPQRRFCGTGARRRQCGADDTHR